MKTRLKREELWPDELPQSFFNRAIETIQYLKNEPFGGRSIVDIGEDNPLKGMIEAGLSVKIDSFNADFDNMFRCGKKYDVILCFEVLEHLFNPLSFLEQLKCMLNKNGVIYLSTPYQYPQCLKAVHHFHEIPTDRLMWLFDAAGLTVVEMKKITIAGNWYNHLTGIRPMLRYFQKTRLFKLTVKS